MDPKTRLFVHRRADIGLQGTSDPMLGTEKSHEFADARLEQDINRRGAIRRDTGVIRDQAYALASQRGELLLPRTSMPLSTLGIVSALRPGAANFAARKEKHPEHSSDTERSGYRAM